MHKSLQSFDSIDCTVPDQLQGTKNFKLDNTTSIVLIQQLQVLNGYNHTIPSPAIVPMHPASTHVLTFLALQRLSPSLVTPCQQRMPPLRPPNIQQSHLYIIAHLHDFPMP